MRNNFWESEEIIESFDKEDINEKIVIKKCVRKNKKYIDIRNHYIKNNIIRHGKGIAIPEHLAKQIAFSILQNVD